MSRMRRAPRTHAHAHALVLVLVGLTSSEAVAQPAFDPAKELLRIAKMKQDDRLLAGFAEARGRTAPNLTEKELFVIVDTVEKVGTPDRAIAMLQQRVKRFPRDLDARVALAKMFARASQTPNAVAVWKELALKLGLTPPLAIEYAHVLSVTGDHAASLSVLASIMSKTPDDAVDYWRELAQAAWDQDDSATALIAYRKVWNVDPPLPAASSRLMQLLSDADSSTRPSSSRSRRSSARGTPRTSWSWRVSRSSAATTRRQSARSISPTTSARSSPPPSSTG